MPQSKKYRTTKALPFHPLSQLFPELGRAEMAELIADIEAHGLIEPIVMFGGGILEGRHRYRACLRAKVRPRFEEFKGDAAAARAFVFSKNYYRRHLKANEKRDAIAKELKAHPEKSDREIGRITKSDKNTVARIRAKEERRGAIHHVEKRTDTKGRQQPATKVTTSKPKPAPAPAPMVPEQPKPEQQASPAPAAEPPPATAVTPEIKTTPEVEPEKATEVKPLAAAEQQQPRRMTKLERELEQGALSQLRIERGQNEDLIEKLRAAGTKIRALESEVADLKAENADLRAQLEATKPAVEETPPKTVSTEESPTPNIDERAAALAAKGVGMQDPMPDSLRRDRRPS